MTAIGPTFRAAHCGSVACTVGLGALPAVVTAVLRTTVGTGPVVVLALAAGAALAWAAEDPMPELLGSTPVGSVPRTALRLAAACLVVAVTAQGALALAGTMARVDGGWDDRWSELAAAAGIGSAVALVMARRRDAGPGPGGVGAALLGPAFATALASRWPRVVPGLGTSVVHGRWWFVAAAGGAVAVLAARDPDSRVQVPARRRASA